jgi:uncharacterized protein (TIGR03086 family)
VDLHGALDVATAGFTRTLRQVRSDQWDVGTPNAGWTVRDLVNHVVGGNRRYVLLLTGTPTSEVEALRDLNHLGADPVADFRTTSVEVAEAFCRPGALARTVHHRLGDRSGAELLAMRVMEHALHGWDLAHAIRADDTIDPPVVRAILAAVDADPTMLERSSFTAVDPGSDPTPTRQLLALSGRR